MITKRSKNNTKQYGAVSLFIVVFTALLMMIITISFVQLMTNDQRQATNNDLSQSAYDSAQAGIEDAKRALLIEQDCIGRDTQECRDVRAAIGAGECNTLSAIFGDPDDAETMIQQPASAEDRKLDQGYTCVKIRSETPNFLGSLDPSMSPVLVPLRATDNFTKIIISWAINKDGGAVNLPSSGTATLPPVGASWPQNRPALMRAQLIDGGDDFRLSDFDGRDSSTLFLYPSLIGSETSQFAGDFRRAGNNRNEPQLVRCSPGVATGDYFCKVTLGMTSANIRADSQTAFLSLGALYNATDFKVELQNGNNGPLVPFNGVQPEIDSTGRANDLFRRVVSRVEMGGNFNYPQAALETEGNLCKNFSITTEPSDYSNQCTP